MNYKVHPLFPQVVCEYVLPEDTTELLNLVKDEPTSYGNPDNRNYRLLDVAPHWKDTLLEPFKHFVENTFKWVGYDFAMATSWGNAIAPGEDCNIHCHANSFYSGVLHLEDADSGELTFYDLTPKYNLGIPERFNNYNSQHFMKFPEKNRILFFPSTLYHKIGYNKTDDYRYSLAFNILPTGKYGMQDSTMQVNVL